MWERATVNPSFSTPIGNDSQGNPTVEGGVFSPEQRRAITCIVFPVKSMVCEENGTAGSSQTEKRAHPKSWVTFRSIMKDAKGGGATASKPASSTGGAGGSRTDVGNDEGSSSSSTSHPDGFGRMPPPSGGIQDDDDAQAQAAIIKDPSFQREIPESRFRSCTLPVNNVSDFAQVLACLPAARNCVIRITIWRHRNLKYGLRSGSARGVEYKCLRVCL